MLLLGCYGDRWGISQEEYIRPTSIVPKYGPGNPPSYSVVDSNHHCLRQQRLLFYQEHVFTSSGAEEALALLLSENARQKAEISELSKKLAVYHEYCVCFQDEVC
jgi:hypothetical protein